MINSGLTKPKFNKVDDPMHYYSKPEPFPAPGKPSVWTTLYIFIAVALMIYAVTAAFLVAMWPKHVQETLTKEAKRQYDTISASTKEADQWRDYVRALIFDQANEQHKAH